MKKTEFQCASQTGKENDDKMVVGKIAIKKWFSFMNYEFANGFISRICLSQKDSLKLATTIINEFCDTKKLSKRVLKSRIACQKVLILELRQEINELKQKNLESTKSYDDIKDLNL